MLSESFSFKIDLSLIVEIELRSEKLLELLLLVNVEFSDTSVLKVSQSHVEPAHLDVRDIFHVRVGLDQGVQELSLMNFSLELKSVTHGESGLREGSGR